MSEIAQTEQSGIRHGTEYAYRWQGCRCAICREYQRQVRARRRAAEPQDQLRAKWRDEKRRQKARS